jgi:hypothetical protein
VTCCQLADEELIEQEAGAFDCTACPLATQMAELDGENRAAWGLYRACCNRFLVDAQAVGYALARLTEDDDPEAFLEKAERLRIIYDVVAPKKTT